MPFPSSLPFCSLLQYSPYGKSDVSRQSRDVRTALKQDGFVAGRRVIEHLAKRVRESLDSHPFLKDCFGPDVLLVPVPRSSLLKPGTLWPSSRICEALFVEGLGGGVSELMWRVSPVRKSATALKGERPSPSEHYDSLKVDPQQLVERFPRITVVDDIITRGATQLGAFARMEEAFPASSLRCFAAMRTVSPGEVESILAPVSGAIEFGAGRLHREP